MAAQAKPRFRTNRFRMAVLLILRLGMALPLHAQVSGGTVGGTVRDQSGALMPDVSLSLANVATGVTRAVVTNARGFYSMPNLLHRRLARGTVLLGPERCSGLAPDRGTALERPRLDGAGDAPARSREYPDPACSRDQCPAWHPRPGYAADHLRQPPPAEQLSAGRHQHQRLLERRAGQRAGPRARRGRGAGVLGGDEQRARQLRPELRRHHECRHAFRLEHASRQRLRVQPRFLPRQ
ncbi:MAG: hypothetical protein DMF78_24635 [Acidobacteria bacterium]|nr:MAG: hypothetical protein DMF78_24635 [Acidobacteriota bacterium]